MRRYSIPRETEASNTPVWENFVVRVVNQVRRPVITVRICLYHILLTSTNYNFVVRYYCI